MRQQIPHYPSILPDGPFNIRLMWLARPRLDAVEPLDLGGLPKSFATLDAILQEAVKQSGAAGARIETLDGGYIRSDHVPRAHFLGN